METQLVVDKENNLKQVRLQTTKFPAAARIIARIFSFIFHPLFIPVYLAWIILQTQSILFSSLTVDGRRFFIPRFILLNTFLPLFSILLMKQLGFISSIYLRTQRDRIIPYVVCMIFYWWGWYTFNHQPEFSRLPVIVTLATFLGCVGGLMANINMKVSMHAIAAAVMTSFIIYLGFTQEISSGIYISGSILLTGIICTARFIDSDHSPKEIYTGLVIGILAFLAAVYFS
jgi:hypothetical protein